MPQSFIYKNILIIAPILLIFIGLLGILFLFKQDLLISYYTIFYAVCFVLGTIWLKAIKQFITNKAINKNGSFLACWAIQLDEDKSNAYFLFTTGNHRHDRIYVNTIRKKMNDEKSLYLGKLKPGHTISLTTRLEANDDVYVAALAKSTIKRKNANYTSNEPLPVLFIDEKNVVPIPGKYMS
ncbi:hypothetical protein D0T56_05680 [Dysgonomonas sp. 520]|nr:hypothetical protein [Dysgonomonas sp. 520]